MTRTQYIKVNLDFVIKLPREVDRIPDIDVLRFIEGGLTEGTNLLRKPEDEVDILPHAKCNIALHRPRKKAARG